MSMPELAKVNIEKKIQKNKLRTVSDLKEENVLLQKLVSALRSSQSRQELASANIEKERIIQKEIKDIAKNCNISELENKNYDAELKELKLRARRLLNENNELEENVLLQKQVSALFSSQSRQELARIKDEKEKIIQETGYFANNCNMSQWEIMYFEAELKYVIKLRTERLLKQNNLLEEGIISIEKLLSVLCLFQSRNDLTKADYERRRILQEHKHQKEKLLSYYNDLEKENCLLRKLNSELRETQTRQALMAINKKNEIIMLESSYLAKIGNTSEWGKKMFKTVLKDPKHQKDHLLSDNELEDENSSELEHVPPLHSFQRKQSLTGVSNLKELIIQENSNVAKNCAISECKDKNYKTEQKNLRKEKPLSDNNELEENISLGKHGSALHSPQENLVSAFHDLTQFYHNVCQIDDETPNQRIMDHMKGHSCDDMPPSIPTSESSPESPESDKNKLNTSKEKLKTDISVNALLKDQKSDLDVGTCNHLIDMLHDKVQLSKNTLELYRQRSLLSDNEGPSSLTEVRDLQEQVAKLNSQLLTKKEQIATLRRVLDANERKAEVAYANLKRKYENRKRTMMKMTKGLKSLKADVAATFASLEDTFAAGREEYVKQLDTLQQKLTRSEDEKNYLLQLFSQNTIQNQEEILESVEMARESSSRQYGTTSQITKS